MQESSDRRFKKNISPLTGALNSVLLMEGVSYNWKQEEFPKRNFGDRTEIGVIAQDLEKIYPELVSTDAEGYKSVQYSHLVPVLLEAIKEQQVVISGMEKTVTELTLQNNRADAQYAELKRAISVLTVQIDDSHQTFDTITDEMKSLSGAIYGDGSVED
jgi:hypothetical protein